MFQTSLEGTRIYCNKLPLTILILALHIGLGVDQAREYNYSVLLTRASRAIYVNMHTWSYVQGREGGGEEGEGGGRGDRAGSRAEGERYRNGL